MTVGTPNQNRRERLPSINSSPSLSSLYPFSDDGILWSETSTSSSEISTAATDLQSEHDVRVENRDIVEDITKTNSDRASTTLVTQDPQLLRDSVGYTANGRSLIKKFCCGGDCCFLDIPPSISSTSNIKLLELPDNAAFRGLELRLGPVDADMELTSVPPVPPRTLSLHTLPRSCARPQALVQKQPPAFVQPHPPYSVYAAPIFHARELTKPGADKHTFHFDIDVTDYPEEGNIDFLVGGAIGVCPPNAAEQVDEVFDILGIPTFARDAPVLLRTDGGRWPTIWADEQSRELTTSRRELLTWCSDIQSYPPSKQLLRLLAAHATSSNEKKLLLYLCSAQGQPYFCNLRTGAHVTLLQILHAFPSAKPPLPDLLSVLPQLMPRFYSLSNDPHISSEREGLAGRRLIEIAVTIHETNHWRGGRRTGLGSGFLKRLAEHFIRAEVGGTLSQIDLRIPLFRGLMANPLSKEFGVSNGPMMLIGAGVGMAPFRGFILNRLKNANCASKIWLVQGVRNSALDELYSGELGRYEGQIKKVVQSRAKKTARMLRESVSDSNVSRLAQQDSRDKEAQECLKDQWQAAKTESRYVQDELRQQADIVWSVIKSTDGRVFVCGSSKGMGEGVEAALREIAVNKGGMSEDGAVTFWKEMQDAGKYVTETW